MRFHLRRLERYTLFGRKYQLSVQLFPTFDERRVIHQHGLDRGEIFYDPHRDVLLANTTASHERAKARGLFVTKARDASAIVGAEISALVSAVRAMRAFNITVADLLQGVTITQPSLRALRDVEQILIECIDSIDASVRAAQNYADRTEDLFAPGNDDAPTVPPAQWTRNWRR